VNPFYRVDNRLVHGQIIATWMPYLRLKRFLVVSDTVSDNPLQMTMFRMAIPHEILFQAMHLGEASKWLADRAFGNERTMVLLESVADAVRLFNAGHPFSDLNIGNVHHGPGRKRFTNAVYLSDDELDQLESIMRKGCRVEIRSLPTETPIIMKPKERR
jgi:PTS system mannose-specific IIB component